MSERDHIGSTAAAVLPELDFKMNQTPIEGRKTVTIRLAVPIVIPRHGRSPGVPQTTTA